MKEKLMRTGLPVLLAVLLAAAGVLLPGAALSRERETYLSESVTVPVTAVRPYGESYEEARAALEQGIELLRYCNGYYGPPEGVAVSEPGDDPAYYAALERARRFWETWAPSCPELPAIQGSPMEFGEQANQVLRAAPYEGAYLVQVSPGGGDGLNPGDLVFEPVTGLPLAFVLEIPAPEGTETREAWEGLLLAFAQAGGIVFNEGPDSVTEWAYDYQETEGPPYHVRYEAVSADEAFLLTLDVIVQDGVWFLWGGLEM